MFGPWKRNFVFTLIGAFRNRKRRLTSRVRERQAPGMEFQDSAVLVIAVDRGRLQSAQLCIQWACSHRSLWFLRSLLRCYYFIRTRARLVYQALLNEVLVNQTPHRVRRWSSLIVANRTFNHSFKLRSVNVQMWSPGRDRNSQVECRRCDNTRTSQNNKSVRTRSCPLTTEVVSAKESCYQLERLLPIGNGRTRVEVI